MATFGTPYEGRDNIIVPGVYTSSLKLLLYTNTAGSLDATTVLGDLTEPSGTGYAQITLNGTFSSSNGVVTYDHGTPNNPSWENSGGSNWTGDVTGAAISNGTYLLHFKDFAAGATTVEPGDTIEIDLSTFIS